MYTYTKNSIYTKFQQVACWRSALLEIPCERNSHERFAKNEVDHQPEPTINHALIVRVCIYIYIDIYVYIYIGNMYMGNITVDIYKHACIYHAYQCQYYVYACICLYL